MTKLKKRTVVAAGIDGKGKTLNITLTDEQAKSLGLSKRPLAIECGVHDCVYESTRNDGFVRISHDKQNAVVSEMLIRNPQPWAVPTREVLPLSRGKWAIISGPWKPLPKDLADAINAIYEFSSRLDVDPGEWEFLAEEISKRISEQEPTVQAMKDALAIIDKAVSGFKKIGRNWVNFHSGNFGVIDGDVVVTDVGLSELRSPREE